MTNPTLNDLYTSIKDDLKVKLGITSLVGKTVLSAFAATQAAKLKLLYLLSADIYNNIFVDTADTEMLKRFGLVKLNRLPNSAIAGEYDIDVTGAIGSTIIAGTTYKSLDTSTNPDKLFVLDADFTFSVTSETIQIRALDLGIISKLEIGDGLQLTAPIANVDSFATVSAIVTTAIAAESEEEYRKEVINSYQLEPQGGARTDYRLWAADAAGVAEVYPYVVSGEIGYIDIYVEATTADSTDGHGTPSSAILTDVENVIEFDPDTTKPLNERGRRPMSVFSLNYIAITPLPVDIIITGLSDSSYLAQILTALDSFLENIRPFIDGADNPSEINKGKLYESDAYNIVRDVIDINATFTGLTLKVNNVQVSLYEFVDGNIPYANTVTNV